jgi:ASC-1-like (ASCH) protein
MTDDRKDEKVGSTTTTMHLDAEWWRHVRDGRKTIEARPCAPRHEALRVGDVIRFQQRGGGDAKADVLHMRIAKIVRHASFESLLRDEENGLARALPGVDAVAEGVERYHAFPDYKSQAALFGVVAWHLHAVATPTTANVTSTRTEQQKAKDLMQIACEMGLVASV